MPIEGGDISQLSSSPSRHAVGANPVGRLAREHPGVVKLGRAGWFAKGVVYIVPGALALYVPAPAPGASPNGPAGPNPPPGLTGRQQR